MNKSVGLWALNRANQFPATYPTSEDVVQRKPAYDILPSGKLISFKSKEEDKEQVAHDTTNNVVAGIELERSGSRKRADSDDAKSVSNLFIYLLSD
jgi:hypothetical protein